jgi:peptidyl-prolyl cis-trans isomerase D
MLRGIRKASANWVGKSIMAAVVMFLVASFAIWGIGDIFRGFGVSRVAKIGSTEIGVEQFRQIYNDRLQQLGRRVGRPVTMDQARALGFDRQILAQLVAESALDERARELGLGLSDAEIAKRITADPVFRGLSGQFDRARFEQLIRQAGYTEPRFVGEQRRASLRRQIADTVTSGVTAPKAAVDAANQHENEQRAVDYVVLDTAQAGDIPPPTPEALAQYFEERKVLFRAPEYRKIVLLALTPGELAKWAEVSDADAKRAFEEQQDRYVTPERRQVQQIVFANPEEARAAADRLAQGLSFAALAAERGLKEQDIDLGLVSKSGMVDRAIADAAFALGEGAVSAPVQGRFGTVLVRAAKIEPGHTRPYEEVAPQIKRDVAAERAKAQVSDAYNKIEDERAAGSSLSDVAQKLNLTATTIEAVDRSGRGPDGAPVAGLPQGTDLLSPAFASDLGVENDPMQLDGGYVWYEVAGITPSRERTLDEVKPQIEARWREDQIAARLRSKAGELLDGLKAGSSLADLATAQGLKLETATGLTRKSGAAPLTSKVVQEVFRTPKGAAAAEGERPTQLLVFRVTDVAVPNLGMAAADAKRTTDTLRAAYVEDLMAQYIARIQKDIGVSINQSALNQVVGGGSTN